jgi:salicylate hydroxylase
MSTDTSTGAGIQGGTGADTDAPRVAVVGAGIAGLTLGLALARAGVPFTIYEQAPQLREVGAGIQVAPSATKLLHRLGLEDAMRVSGFAPAAMEFRRWADNSVLVRNVLGADYEERYGAPYYTFHRADLQRTLADALPAGALRLGQHCTGFDETADAVTVRFADGSSTTADVVVGADGIHSAIRDAMVADHPRFSGETIYRGLVPAERLPFLLEEPKVILWLGPGRHCVCYPVAGGRLVSFAATAPGSDWQTESWSAQGRVSDLVAAYDGWNDDVVTVLGSADAVSRWALHDRDPIERWSTDRITLVGDSAHPMLPFLAQGANQAIEDAVVLAGCLRDAGSTGVATALRRYEAIRKARTAEVQNRSRGNTTTFHLPDGEEQRKRDAAMTTLDRRAQDWLYGYDAEAALAEPAPV